MHQPIDLLRSEQVTKAVTVDEASFGGVRNHKRIGAEDEVEKEVDTSGNRPPDPGGGNVEHGLRRGSRSVRDRRQDRPQARPGHPSTGRHPWSKASCFRWRRGQGFRWA